MPLRSSLSYVLILILSAASLQAQIKKAPLSPRGQLQQQAGLAQISIDYGRPGVKGREIFGALEPYGRVWRTGANACTKITFDRSVQLGGEEVPAGTYGLFTIPEKKRWTFILNKNAKLWGAGGYDPAQDQLRLELKPEKLKASTETLTIDLEGFHANGAELTIAWEKVRIRVPVFVDSDAEVFAEIDSKVRKSKGKVSAQSYFDAAMFLYEKNEKLAEAAKWMEQAVKGSPQAFWMVYYKAELASVRGKKKEARSAAERALSMAESSRADYGYAAKSRLLLKKLGKR